jgi:pSer/pThr/pTyr-binding forkhead associated (FHA) protein/outer membrane biosynthesis protein TonB
LKQPIILRVFKSNQLKEVKQFDIDQIVVGSNQESQLILVDDAVSPIHCLLEKRDTGYYVCDLGSKSGTFKNGQAILDEPVVSGDELIIGPFKIVFFVGVPKPVGQPKDLDKTVVIPSATAAPIEKTTVAPIRDEKTNAIDKVIDDDKTHSDQKTIPEKPVVPAQVKKPEIATKYFQRKASKKKKYSFAPPGEIKDLKTYLSPTKGSLVEVNLAWNERIIQTYHYRNKGIVRTNLSQDKGLFLPSPSVPPNWPLIDFGAQLKVLLPAGSEIELINAKASTKEDVLLGTGKAIRMAQGVQVRVDQNELLWVRLPDKNLTLIIRFVETTPLVPYAPLLLSSSEMGSLLISVIISGMLAFYVATMTSKFQPPQEEDKSTYTAQVLFNETKVKEEKIPPPPPKPEIIPDKQNPPPPEPPKVVKMAEEKKETTKKGDVNVKHKGQKTQVAQKAVEVAPNPNTQNRPKKFTSVRQGGAVKIGQTAGANAQSAQPKDVNKMGLFSAFGSGGVRSKLDQAYQGAGDILGSAGKATGSTGMGENREGDDLGSKFKDTGAGGKGTATEGIAGIGTKGRAGGTSEYGSTEGFGDKTAVAIQAGGSEESFTGSIDKEAVRRRIKHNLNLIRGCYNQELNRLDKTGRRGLEGKVVLKWDIIDNGVAKNVRVSSSTLGNSIIEKCIAERLATIVFPDPPDGTMAEVSYPFVFKNEQ